MMTEFESDARSTYTTTPGTLELSLGRERDPGFPASPAT